MINIYYYHLIRLDKLIFVIINLPVTSINLSSTPSSLRALNVAKTSSLSNKFSIVVLPTAHAPSISALWEIDLSPGTNISPLIFLDLILLKSPYLEFFYQLFVTNS